MSAVVVSTTAGPPTAGPRPRRGGLLWHRDFRLLWIGQTSSNLGSSVTSVALPLIAVVTLDAPAFEVALLSAAAWLPWLVIGLPAGAWVDRLPRRPVMIICDVLAMLLFLSVPLAWWWGALTMGHLLAVALLAGAASVFFQTAYQVYLPGLLARDRVAEGNAKLQSTEAAAGVAGPGLAGLIAGVFGAVLALLADAVSFLVSAVCLLAIRTPEKRAGRTSGGSPSGGRSLRREIGDGFGFLVRDPYLRVLALFGAACNLALIGYQAVLVVFLVRVVGLSPTTVGGLVAAMSLGGVLGAAGATRISRRFGSARALVLCELCAAPFGLLLPLAQSGPRLVLAAMGGAILCAGVYAGNVIKGSFRQTYTPHHLLGRVTVSMQLLNYGTIPVGALLSGVLGTTLGVRSTMWLMLAGVPVSALILLVGPIRRHRNLPDRPGTAPGRGASHIS